MVLLSKVTVALYNLHHCTDSVVSMPLSYPPLLSYHNGYLWLLTISILFQGLTV